jgi:hypothetical protein
MNRSPLGLIRFHKVCAACISGVFDTVFTYNN